MEYKRTMRSFFVRTGKGGVTKVLREHYLRNDLSPAPFNTRSRALDSHAAFSQQRRRHEQQHQEALVPPSRGDALHDDDGRSSSDSSIVPGATGARPWMVVCPATCHHFLEMLELDDLTHVIILETTLMYFGPGSSKQPPSSFPYRYLPRLRAVGNDSKRSNCIFYNEHFERTHTMRESDEPLPQRHARAVVAAVSYLTERLSQCIITDTNSLEYQHAPLIPSSIVLVTSDATIIQAANARGGIQCMTLSDYIEVSS